MLSINMSFIWSSSSSSSAFPAPYFPLVTAVYFYKCVLEVFVIKYTLNRRRMNKYNDMSKLNLLKVNAWNDNDDLE